MRCSLAVGCIIVCAALWGGCEECKETKVTEMLFPVKDDTVYSATAVDYREYPVGITCINSDFIAVASQFPENELVAQYRATTENSVYGSYAALAAVIHSEAAFAALSDAGCLNDFIPSAGLSFDAQTLVVVTVLSSTGCDAQTTVTLQEDSADLAFLSMVVSYIPGDTCSFEWSDAVIIDQPGAKANLVITSGCADDNASSDPEM
ncbi:MAG: hypothetical protein JXX29_09345 [Deltaproteobacteria bacterium]|nr:hypothetical protein [Deltaproteobacteria bacterium]MBN2671868.1 hypothetical protein [Deltaproteobacteria bacterium]